jgi:tetratricopeptide (TPR) repeat protein
VKRALLLILLAACRAAETPAPSPVARPSILLVTLDTTRFDSIGPDAKGVTTPAFNTLVQTGRRFTQAYATAPQTLPSHSSMLTGLLPAGHGVHENARPLAANHPLASEKLREHGYRTAAFVSSFSLAKRFGLQRGFEVYDDDFSVERSATETTDRALTWLRGGSNAPTFLWVHYFDPHHPYVPDYRAEIAMMDAQLGRLVTAFREHARDAAIIVAADHGEALGDHGEAQHGYLLYQSVMHVPLVIAGPGVAAGTHATPVSTRRVFHTLLDFAGISAEQSLRGTHNEVVVGEGMIPFLDFGWQPQVMAVEGRLKVIQDGALQIYDVLADPNETRNLAGKADLSRGLRAAINDYPIPSPAPAAPSPAVQLSVEEQRKLAALGYISSDVRPTIRKDAPRPAAMTHLFEPLDRASGLFVAEEYARAVPLFEQILASDPHNLMAALRLAAAHSALGRNDAALTAFRRAEAIAPDSADVRLYLGLHYARTDQWPRAIPLLEPFPDRLPALEALAVIRERQNRLPDALTLRKQIATLRTPTAPDLVRTGELAMATGDTATALDSFERARTLQGQAFRNDLELGVLYLATRRFQDARTSLDRVPPTHPGYPMALFKRAQVSVLLNEPDRTARINKARQHADATTRELIASERLFR